MALRIPSDSSRTKSRGPQRAGSTSPWRPLRTLRRRLRPPVTITAPPADIVIERDVAVPVRDGTVLRVNIFRPPGGGRHPVLLCAHPYSKDRTPVLRRFGRGYRIPFQYRLMPQSQPFAHSALTGWEGPDPAYWVTRGYIVINADLRGWGTSGGVGDLLSEQEGLDCHDVIEWAAARPWSNGRIGMTGVSYLAITQWAAASTRPPHLAAICPWEGFTDVYRNFAHPGGVAEIGFLPIWGRGLRAQHRSPMVVDRMSRDRPLYDEYWAARARPLEQIDVPALICGSFSDHNLHSVGSFEGFRRIGSQHAWLYTHRGPKWATYYSADGLAVQAQFFDHFLAGQDTGILQRAPVRIEVRADRDTITAVRADTAWPPTGTVWHTLHLDSRTGTLAAQSPGVGGGWRFDTRRGCASFTHRFDSDTEVVGSMLLSVAISVRGADDLSLFAGVRKFTGGAEVLFEGSYGFTGDLVTHATLLASHRRTDPQRSLPQLPFHPHTISEPLRPDEIVTLDLALAPSATLFRAGEELRLDLQGHWFFAVNPFFGQFPARYAASPRATATVHTGGDFASTLTIPTSP
ncbi:MAG: CocE/NonD family hydrolase [Nakamurella sp.]